MTGDDLAGAEIRQQGLSVVIPCFNEAAGLDVFLDELLDELGYLDLELICVDDGSRDDTLAILRRRAETDPRIHYLSFTRNFGVEAAFSAGYSYASKPWLVHMDADGQFPPDQVRLLIAESDGMDAVFGIRTVRHDPWLRKVGSRVNQFVARTLLGIEMPRGATCFRLVRTELARAVVSLDLGNPYFLATLPRLTNRYRLVPVRHRPRGDGPARVRFWRLAGHALDLWFGFSRRPTLAALLVASWAAAMAVLLGLLHFAGAVGEELMAGAVILLVGSMLLVTAIEVRCLGVLLAAQPRPRLFYIREATLPILPEDTFVVLVPEAQPSARPDAQELTQEVVA